MKRGVVLAVFALCAVFCLFADCLAAPESCQVPTQSWHGLTGLYVIPTARLIGKGNFAVGFNESKHSEWVYGGRYNDRQIRGVVTFGAADWLELSGTYYNNMYMLPPDAPKLVNNRPFYTLAFKARLMEEHRGYWFPEVSVAVRDITNRTGDTGQLKYVGNGAKLYLLASKRTLTKEDIGRFLDLHAGVTYDHNGVSGLVGFELTLSENMSLIAEGIWDSPYMDFRDFGQDDVKGRFLFDTGVRIYPQLIRGLALDLGFVGDSEFEFSFGASYMFPV